MNDSSALFAWQNRLQAAATALAKCPDAPAWLKDVVLDAYASGTKIAPDKEGDGQGKDHAFFYPH